ncbi:DUF3078 domain-containing protein [Robiginitalea sp.]|uniref:DUF3078 domain-containing protein n=1 Tax=Robiginitalea sp. TaxID=1902411 RepID=UPI003C794FDA
MKRILLVITVLFAGLTSYGQTLEELKAAKKQKEDSVSAINGRIGDLKSQIDAFPGWKLGAFGTIGGSLSGFNNWYAQETPNNSTGRIGITVNPYAKLDREKYFWYNTAQLNIGWVKFDDKDDPDDQEGFRQSNDVFNITSLFGYNLTSKLAASTLMEYRSTILSNFNDPGYLDLGVGITWRPISGLVVVAHPLNYNFVFSSTDDIFKSSFGAKLLATYDKSLGGFNWKSQFSAFASYEDSNLSNWTWTNNFAYKVWKDIGLGFEFGLRDNKQEALNYEINTLGNAGATFDNIDNKLQTYWLFGLTYDF